MATDAALAIARQDANACEMHVGQPSLRKGQWAVLPI